MSHSFQPDEKVFEHLGEVDAGHARE